MNSTRAVLLLSTVLAFTGEKAGASRDDADRTLSPYFFVKSDDPELDQLPLKSTSADVDIAGVIAEVRVTQVYKNEGKKPIEAVYVFPGSTRAAVHSLKMTIGERTIVAKIRKREEARKEYEKAKAEGKTASLLEQQRPNVFQMNVANILPGDLIHVELGYTELLVPTDGIYEFVYPTVVGPRYSNQLGADAPESERWIENPYFHEGEAPSYSFQIQARLATGMPIRDLGCPSHEVDVRYEGSTVAKISLPASESQSGNRDFILRYRLAGDRVETGLLLYEGETENFFLLMLQPPSRPPVRQIPPREYIFVVDVSGSMHGFPLQISKELLRNLIGSLRSTDRFNVLLFAGGSALMAETSVPATSENVQKAIQLIEAQTGGGGTELLPALKRALAIPRPEGLYSRTIVVATDGYVSVEGETFELIRTSLGDSNMFSFGIGTSVNRHVIEGMARMGLGESFVVFKPEEARAKAEKFRKYIAAPVLIKPQVRLDGFEAYEVEPSHVPDVFAERPIIVFGKYRGKAGGKILLEGQTSEGTWSKAAQVSEFRSRDTNRALRHLWARHRIMLHSDFNSVSTDESRINEITRLGLTYNLLTAYTSFVAVDTQVRRSDGKLITVEQPLPLPQGVSDRAVGGAGSGGVYTLSSRGAALGVAGGVVGGLDKLQITSEEPTVESTPIRVDNQVQASKLVKRVEPEYPELARRARVQGVVALEVKINEKGEVVEAKVIQGHPLLNQAAVDAVKRWKYHPTLLNGRPVAVVTTVTVPFKLN